MPNLSLQTPTIKKEAEHLVDLLRYQRFYVTHSGIPLGLCISLLTITDLMLITTSLCLINKYIYFQYLILNLLLKIRISLRSVLNYLKVVNNTIFIPLPPHFELWVQKKKCKHFTWFRFIQETILAIMGRTVKYKR